MLDPNISRAADRVGFLSAEDERALLERAQAGDDAARDQIVLAHLKLAIAAAMRAKHHGVSVDDLTHEGIIGLVEAVDRFDLGADNRFSTYATWWVKARVSEFVIGNAGPVKTSTSAAGKALFFRLRAERARLERTGTLSRSQVNAQLAELFGVSHQAIETASARLAGADVSMDDSDAHLTIADPSDMGEAVEKSIDNGHLRDALKVALATLTEREREIVCARYYCEDEAKATLEELGDRLRVSKERVRQLEVRGLEKLRRALGGSPRLLAA